jgi:DNA-binding FadR family transcriptional regulator
MAKEKKVPSGSSVRRVAHALREEILKRPDGALLGSEAELVTRLGVSRPTFRQAAKLVEQEQLLLIKRGVGGGFFVRRPTVQAVTHVASVYLLSRKATMGDAIRTARPLFAETARLGAIRANRANNKRVAEFLKRQQAAGEEQFEIHGFLKFEREFLDLFASLSGNPVLQLQTELLVDFAGGYVGSSVYAGHPERITRYCAIRNELLESIIGGDEQIAQLLALRRSDLILGWLEDDLAAPTARRPAGRTKRAGSPSDPLIGLAVMTPGGAPIAVRGRVAKPAGDA